MQFQLDCLIYVQLNNRAIADTNKKEKTMQAEEKFLGMSFSFFFLRILIFDVHSTN